MPAVAPFATVYALDLLGAGFSERPKGIDHSMRATALRVLEFARRMGLSSFDLLGTSRGGAVAMSAAAECLSPGSGLQVPRLILACPVNPYSSHGRWLAPFFATRIGSSAFRWVMETSRGPKLYPRIHGRLFFDRKKIPPGSLEGYSAPLAIPGLFGHALSIVKTWTADLRELEGILPRLRQIPTLLMWGDRDTAVHISSMEPLAAHFSNAQKVVFPNVGDLPYEECPEEFNRALTQFLIR